MGEGEAAERQIGEMDERVEAQERRTRLSPLRERLDTDRLYLDLAWILSG